VRARRECVVFDRAAIESLAGMRYLCTYTHMKSQKKKKWLDGVAIVANGKAIIVPLSDGEDALSKAAPVLETCALRLETFLMRSCHLLVP
jgi:hypothetical protein